jgi:hypothetical protein
VEWNVAQFSSGMSVEGALPAGRQRYASGVYFCMIKAEKFVDTKKMILLK